MHSYLIVGKSSSELEGVIDKLIKKFKAERMDFELQHISDVRELNNFTKLTMDKKTAIVIVNIDTATTQTLNAFLKNLEEPQKNVYYLLTTQTLHNLLPTIISRCQVIKTGSFQKLKGADKTGLTDFINDTQLERFKVVDNIRLRVDAVAFVQGLINIWHSRLISGSSPIKTADNLKSLSKTLYFLKQNGNVHLQLTNLVLNLV